MRQDPKIESESVDILSSSSEGIDQEPQLALEDYRQRYGLSVDPFGADPYFPFFTGGQRRELLDQVIHLCQFGYGVPVVMGERGVGKTRLALALYESIASDGACFIGALPTLSSSALLGQIAQHFGVGSKDSDTELLKGDLREFCKSSGDGLAVVLIDDAHDLDDQSLAAILDVAQIREQEGGGIQLVLFGDISLIARLNKLNHTELSISDFYVERFTLGETTDYLNFRMEMADYLGPEMFTEAQVEPWWRQAQGQLPQIHRAAREHLLEAVLPPLSNRTRRFPIVHIVAIAVLGGAVLMTLLYRSDSSEQDAPSVQRVPINLQQPVRNEVAPVNRASVEEPESPVISSAVQPVADGEVVDAEAPSIAGAEQAAAVNDPVATSIPQVAEEPPAAIKPPPAEVVRPAPAAQQAAQNNKSRTSFSSDEEVLLSWNASDYTLQLLGVSSEKAARDFIASQPNRNDLLMFKTLRQGKDWFVVVAGRYQNAAAAKAAVSGLPQEQVKAGPWPRELKVIQVEISRVN